MLSSQVLGLVQRYLSQFAASAGFLDSIADIYGVDVNDSGLLGLRQGWLNGDFGKHHHQR